ncbi:MAG: ArsC family reductase [Thiotrichales bacterium]
MTTLYGIKNCDTIRKARRWLADHDIDYEFHDFRSDGVDATQLQSWAAELGWETLLNRRGTTWRKLPEAQREGIDEKRAIALMVEHPAMIKRPVLDLGDRRIVGFKEAQNETLFS